MITTIQNTVHTMICQLIGNICAAITKNAPCHMQLYIRADIFFIKSSSFKIIPRSFFAMFIRKILQITLTGLVAYRAIEWMVDQ